MYDHLCVIPPIGGYSLPGNDAPAQIPTPPPKTSPEALKSLPKAEREQIEQTEKVQQVNYEKYQLYAEEDCDKLKSPKNKDDCEISQNPQLRGVNDQLTTQPEAVAQFKAAEVVSEELEEEETMKDSFTNVAVLTVAALIIFVALLDLPLAVLDKIIGGCANCCTRKPKVGAFWYKVNSLVVS